MTALSRIPPRAWILAVILAVAAAVRLVALDRIPPGMWYDEAIYALDGLSIGHGNWPIFFSTEGHPREPLYIYYLGGFFSLFGHSVWKARLASALWGIAAVALFWPVARRLLGESWGLVATGAFAVFRWHVHFSRTVFRALLPSFFILAVVLFFLRWKEKRRSGDAIACGLFLGAGAYTYLSWRLVPLILLAWWGWMFARGELRWRRDWRPLALILGTAFLVFVPLGVDYLRNPWHFTGRTGEVSMFVRTVEKPGPDGRPVPVAVRKSAGEVAADLAGNARDVALMWTVRGDHVGKHNLPFAPVFDWASGLCFYAGLAWCFANLRRRHEAVLLPAWLFTMSLASVFSFGAPNLLRMQGATPAAILTMVAGMRWIGDGLGPFVSRRALVALGAATLLVNGFLQMDVYFRRFPVSDDVRREFNTEMFYDPGELARAAAESAAEVWVPGELADHPTFAFVVYGLPQLRRYGAADDVPTTGPRPVALLVTARSESLAAGYGRDPVERFRNAGARLSGVAEITVPATDTEPRRRAKWAELWVLR